MVLAREKGYQTFVRHDARFGPDVGTHYFSTVVTNSWLQSKCFVGVKMSDLFYEAFRISNERE